MFRRSKGKTKTPHSHRFSEWVIASNGLIGAFSGSVTVDAIQMRRCKTKSCGYYQAEKLL